ncbi:MAG TPA: glycosyltransferase family 4 protein [Actinocrinis sp.]|nr:glycosyltransferase family 4 protein [Actinocrinis sp.]
MRIAMVSAHYAPFAGGVESHVEEIAKRLADRGESVEVLTHHDDPGLPDTEVREGVLVRRHKVPVTSQHFGLSPAVWATLVRQRHRYDVVHAHGYHSAAPLAAALAGASPLVFTPHYHGTGHSPLRKAIHVPYRAAGVAIAARSKRIICVSRAEADLFLTHFPSARPRVTVIPNGADLGRITAAQPFPDAGAVVITGGRLQSYKQIDRIVNAMALTPAGLRLVVTGDGPERGALEALADQSGVRAKVRFIGRVEPDLLYRWYASADVFCSMSSNEAMPVTILELLAAGARVVASDIPAHRDIRDRTAGAITLVPLDADPEVLASALEQALKQSPAPEQQIPTWDEVTTQTLDIYRDLASAAAVA